MTIQPSHKRQIINVISLCLMSLLFSSCMTSEMPPLDANIPTHWRQNDLSKINGSVSSDGQWWRHFQDPLLDKLIDIALSQNLTLQQASERIIFARAVQKQELASEKPQANLYAGPNNLARALATNGSGVGQANQPQYVSSGAYLAGFDLLWELPIFGQGPGQRQVTQADLQISQTELFLKQISLTSEIVRVYAELLAAVARSKELELTENDYSSWKSLLTKGVDHGLIAPEEIETLTEGLKTTQRLKRQNLINRESALQRLAVLTGLGEPDESWLKSLQARNEKTLLETQEELSLPQTLPADIIRQRPDVKIAESQVLKATGALGIAKSDLYPKLSIEGALMTTGRVTAERSRHTGSTTYIAPSIRIPLLDLGLRRQAVNQRESQLREALLAYKEAVLLAIEETENAIMTFNQSRDQLIDDNSELKRLQNQLTKLNNSVETGYSSKLDVFKQAIKNQQASLQFIDAKLAWMRSYAYANKAISVYSNLTPESSNN